MPLYHGTPAENVSAIKREGLIPTDRTGMNGMKAISFSEDINVARGFARDGVIFAVDGEALDPRILREHPQRPRGELIYTVPVPAKLLRVVVDNRPPRTRIREVIASLFSHEDRRKK